MEAERRMEDPVSRLQRARAEQYERPVHGGDDPTARDLVLELWEHKLFLEGRGADLGEAGPTGYRPKRTGDSVTDRLEEALARGDEIDLDAARL